MAEAEIEHDECNRQRSRPKQALAAQQASNASGAKVRRYTQSKFRPGRIVLDAAQEHGGKITKSQILHFAATKRADLISPFPDWKKRMMNYVCKSMLTKTDERANGEPVWHLDPSLM